MSQKSLGNLERNKTFLELHENENTTKPLDTLTSFLQEKFIALSAYIKKKKSERAQINDLMMQLKNLEKQEENNPKPSRQQEIIEIREEMS